ncbi:MAG TPA: hypothetical protein VI408_14790 [Gaiellaceae bacterium]
MLRVGVVAAVLACVLVVIGGQRHSASAGPVEHTCGLTDRQFIDDYQQQVTLVEMYGDDFVHGAAKGKDVVAVARGAAASVRRGRPLDPSLQLARKYARAMFLQYADAVTARDAGSTAAREMYLAQQIGARLKDVLAEAQPGLAAKGCDVSDLLE